METKWYLAVKILQTQKTSREDIMNIATGFYVELYSSEEFSLFIYTNTSAANVGISKKKLEV